MARNTKPDYKSVTCEFDVQKQTVLVDEDGSKYGVSYKVSEDGERLVGVDYDPVSEKTPVTAIPTTVSQVGIDVTLTGGQSDVFDGARGFFVFLDDSQSYGFEIPVEFKKSPDGVVGFSISSVDPSKKHHR
jgi:hypothetical protein